MGIYDIDGNNLTKSVRNGKKLSILGDSISTFSGYIPSGNAVFYPRYDVQTVGAMWWKKLIDATGMVLDINNSWSGSRVTTTGSTDTAGCMTRCQNLGENPDIIIVWMGINDFNNETALGTYDGSGDFPTATNTFREAYAIMLNKILTKYKQSEVWVCTLPYDEMNGAVGFPEKNDSGVPLSDYNTAIMDMANLFGVKILDLSKCGLTYQNMDAYMGDYSAENHTGLHPNVAGHSLIANYAISQIDPPNTARY